MKINFLSLIVAILSLSLTSCDEEEAPLQFDTIENSDPENITLNYYCPDLGPIRGYKEYFITATFNAGEIRMKCNNCHRIEIETSFSKPCILEGGGNSLTKSTSEETGIIITLEKDNILNISFADRNSAEYYGLFGKIIAFGKVGGNDEQTIINISRYHR